MSYLGRRNTTVTSILGVSWQIKETTVLCFITFETFTGLMIAIISHLLLQLSWVSLRCFICRIFPLILFLDQVYIFSSYVMDGNSYVVVLTCGHTIYIFHSLLLHILWRNLAIRSWQFSEKKGPLSFTKKWKTSWSYCVWPASFPSVAPIQFLEKEKIIT